MLCQVCKQNKATTYVKTIINGQLTQMNLCDQCAREQGFGTMFGGVDIGDFLGGIFSNQPAKEDVQRCDKCGASFEEIAGTGKIGCACCYVLFKDQLAPLIQRIHGSAVHKGKQPGGYALRITDNKSQIMPVKESKLKEKQRRLKEAIEQQEFEIAAKLRDEIKEMGENG